MVRRLATSAEPSAMLLSPVAQGKADDPRPMFAHARPPILNNAKKAGWKDRLLTDLVAGARQPGQRCADCARPRAPFLLRSGEEPEPSVLAHALTSGSSPLCLNGLSSSITSR